MRNCNTCGVELVAGTNWGSGAVKIGNNICLACNAAKSRKAWAARAPIRAAALEAKRAEIKNIECGTCGTSFKPKSVSAKYCSSRCEQRANYARKPFNPETFGTGTTANRGRKQSPEHVRKRQEAAAKSLSLTVRNCCKCGEEFTPTMAAQKYCSGRCWNSVARARRDKLDRIRIHADHYAQIFEMQGGLCAICKSPSGSNGRGDKLAVDHCHDSKQIRGLLCHKCNTALGLFKDDAERLQAALDYLATAKARAAPS